MGLGCLAGFGVLGEGWELFSQFLHELEVVVIVMCILFTQGGYGLCFYWKHSCKISERVLFSFIY